MNDEVIEKITASMEKKIGAENFAKMADDIGELITQNANTQKQLQEQADEMAKLRKNNETLIVANGNLLKQIPVHNSHESMYNDEEDGEKKYTSIDFRDVFDERGNFIR